MQLALLLLLLALSTASALFPNGTCVPSSCLSSPYQLIWTRDYGSLCFKIGPQACSDPSGNDCCTTLTNSLQKIVLTADPSCQNSVQRITVNGGNKLGGVFFDVYTPTWGELRLENLGLDPSSAIGTEICIQIKGVATNCNTISSFCINGASKSCLNAVSCPPNTVCCPACPFTETWTNPPPSPPSPPPPSPGKLQHSPPPAAHHAPPPRKIVVKKPPPARLKRPPPPPPAPASPSGCDCCCCGSCNGGGWPSQSSNTVLETPSPPPGDAPPDAYMPPSDAYGPPPPDAYMPPDVDGGSGTLLTGTGDGDGDDDDNSTYYYYYYDYSPPPPPNEPTIPLPST